MTLADRNIWLLTDKLVLRKVLRNVTCTRNVMLFYIIYHLIYYAHVILCVCGIWSHVFAEEPGMTVFEREPAGDSIAPREGA